MWVSPTLGKGSVSEAKYTVFILFWRNIVSSDNKYLKVAETFVFRNFWVWLSLLQQLRFIEPWLYFRYYVDWVLYLTCGSAVQLTMMDSKPSPALKANCRPVGVVAAFVHVCVCTHTHISCSREEMQGQWSLLPSSGRRLEPGLEEKLNVTSHLLVWLRCFTININYVYFYILVCNFFKQKTSQLLRINQKEKIKEMCCWKHMNTQGRFRGGYQHIWFMPDTHSMLASGVCEATKDQPLRFLPADFMKC